MKRAKQIRATTPYTLKQGDQQLRLWVIRSEDFAAWFDPSTPMNALAELLKPFPVDEWEAFRVTNAVTRLVRTCLSGSFIAHVVQRSRNPS